MEKRKREQRIIAWHRNILGPTPVTFYGFRLIVLPAVFCPSIGEGSNLLAQCLTEVHNKTVLDMGTGSGALAILSAMRGAHVVATDVSADATKCAHVNVQLNNMQNSVHVRTGDLFAPISDGERFDLILFNPPFMSGHPIRGIELAIYDHNCSTLERFLRQASTYLNPAGRILLAYSNIGCVDKFINLIEDCSLHCTVKAHTGNVLRFYVVELSV